MATRRHSPKTPPGGDWLTLTELGRRYGVSAVHTGKLLVASGLRRSSGEPTAEALAAGLAMRPQPGHHHASLWLHQGCAPHLERLGLVPQAQRTLVSLWADLLSALQHGSPSISVSVEEMADDVPRDLVTPVNRELRQRGCSFRVNPKLRTTAGPGPACSPAPASDATGPRQYG
ncbi:MAG: hypothetical protein QUV07_01480 [Cyanobium sp. CZS 25K]|nr:hypothetical protein [Cyanobium sp. CZS25K]